ncbi:MAG: diguanylate cyclase, partial [Coriobacteriia bacterium]|nr:diguanylate cyclase [Coriobacteriia bacterium]
MGLRTRTLVIVASVLAVFFAALLFIVRPAVVAAFNRLEIDQAEIDGEHLERAIDDETERLERIVSDWAPRNSIHQYMQGSNQEYESEYTADTLAGADINLLIALDENGAIVLSRFADLDLRVLVDADEDVLEAILDNEALQDPGDPRAHAAGAIAYRDGFMLVASRSITTSDLYGVPEGTLIAGRYLDESGIGLLADHTGLEVTAIPATGTARSSEVSRIIEALGPEDRSLVEVADADSIGIYVLVRDLQDRPLLLLRQETPRDVHVISQAVLYSQFVALLLIGIMTIVAVAILLDRSVLRRVSNLSGEMAGIALRADLSTRVSVRGRDEIASLATDINDALEAIEDSEQELVHARDQLEVRVIERTEELRSSEERYRSLVERLSDAVFIVDSGGLVTFANRRAEEIAERPMREIIGSRFSDLLSPASADEVERRTDAGISHLTGLALEVMMGDRACGPAPVELRSVPLFDEAGVPSGVQWIARDIAERKRFEEQLVHMANHDFLTGLFNRQFFESALELELADGRRTGLGGAVLWLDVDDFKEVNDTLGHRAGDEVLVSLATRLHSEIRESTVVTRLGGDEFAA